MKQLPRYGPFCRFWPIGQKVKGQGQIFPKMHKKIQSTGHISEAISLTDFILGTKVQPNKAHFMTQEPMTLTKGQGHRSNIKKLAKIYKMGHIWDAISPTDFILDTKVQPNKAHSMTQVSMTLTQGQRSRSNFPKNS